MDHLSLPGQLHNPDDYWRGMSIAARLLAHAKTLSINPAESRLGLLLALLCQSKRDGLSESGTKALIAMAWGHVDVKPRGASRPLSAGNRAAWAAWAEAERLDGMGLSSYLVAAAPAPCSPLSSEDAA